MYQDDMFLDQKAQSAEAAPINGHAERRYSIFAAADSSDEEVLQYRAQTKLFVFVELVALVEQLSQSAVVTVFGTSEPESKYFEFVSTKDGARMHAVCIQDKEIGLDLVFDVAGYKGVYIYNAFEEATDPDGDRVYSRSKDGVTSYVSSSEAQESVLDKENALILLVDNKLPRTHLAIGKRQCYPCQSLKNVSEEVSCGMRDRILERIQALSDILRRQNLDSNIKASLTVISALLRDRLASGVVLNHT